MLLDIRSALVHRADLRCQTVGLSLFVFSEIVQSANCFVYVDKHTPYSLVGLTLAISALAV